MIIDTHTHFYNPTRPQGVPWPSPEDTLLYRTVLPSHCKQLALPLGVTGTVVVEASSWLEDNQWILDLAAADPFIVGLVGNIEANQPEFGQTLARFAANPLFRGIRCGGRYLEQVEAGTFLQDIATLAAHDLSLDLLIRSEHFAAAVNLAQRLPDLRIIIDHIGHIPIDGQAITLAWVEHYQRLAEQSNIFLKLSALMEQSINYPAPTDLDFYRPTLDALWNAFGAERLIYGSNWPVCERAGDFYAQGVTLVKQYFAEKGEPATANYFWKNSKRVYKWVAR